VGPVDCTADELLGRKFNGHVGPALAALAAPGMVWVLDPVMPKKGDHGSRKSFELSDLDDSETGALHTPGGSTCPHHAT
jgi:hypothetical protein